MLFVRGEKTRKGDEMRAGEARREFKITPSHGKGIPCMWECGGAYSNRGYSQILAGSSGEAKEAIYIRRSGSLACSEHALVPIQQGDFVVEASHHRGDFLIDVWKIVSLDNQKAEAELVTSFRWGEWNPPLPEYLKKAVDASIKKASCYHCRSPHYCVGYTDEGGDK